MASLQICTYAALGGLLYVLYRRLMRISIAHVPGPKSDSFLVGNLHEFFSSQAGECDFKWKSEFGDIVRIKAPLGEDQLLVMDPKALHYIYHASGYDNFAKPPARRELARAISGSGVTWAEGESHKRQRRIMLPGLGLPESRALFPVFSRYAIQVADKWKEILETTKGGETTINVSQWFCRAALDAIGEAAFDYRFKTLENNDDPLGQAYFRLTMRTYGVPTKAAILMQGITNILPQWLVRMMFDYAPMRSLSHARATARLATAVAEDLVQSKITALGHGEVKKDILSLLVKSNSAANEKLRLSHSELISQMRALMFTGHETSANMLSWILLELACHPLIQERLREEIRETERACRSRGSFEFTAVDLDGMVYFNAVLKEAFRMHPVGISTFRQATRDCVLPLSKPIVTASGRILHELPIPRGLNIIGSVIGYNRNKEVFGEDAHRFNPNRWLVPTKEDPNVTKLGVYHNLFTFSGGVRTCPGWRVAITEMQAFLAELINTFEFSLTDQTKEIRRESALVMVPTIEGRVDEGAQLPLRVKLARRD